MPTSRQPGVRPIVYPGGSYRTSRQVAAINDEHSAQRLPVHKTIDVYEETGEGYDALMAEILKYNAIDQDAAENYVVRLLLEPASIRHSDRMYEATILGVTARLHKAV